MAPEVAAPLPVASKRLVSLDVFRGMTIALMVMVNNPGSWGDQYGPNSSIYEPLRHAPWHGWTPTDLVFPFFLFIVGVAMTFSFDKRLHAGFSRVRLMEGVVRRAIVLFLLGLILGGFPNFRMIIPFIMIIAGLEFIYKNDPVLGFGTDAKSTRNKIIGWAMVVVSVLWIVLDFKYFNGPYKGRTPQFFFPINYSELEGGYLRIPGVLQRIALCFLFGALIMFFFKTTKERVAWIIALTVGFWIVMILGERAYPNYTFDRWHGKFDPNVPYNGSFIDVIDSKLLGNHLLGERPDPEGLLSTIPSIATVLLGVICGSTLKSDKTPTEKCSSMFATGVVLCAIGYLWDQWFPINKKIWSSSYVFMMGGLAYITLAFCYYCIDVRNPEKEKKWTVPLVVFGTNPILVFFGSGIMVRLSGLIKMPDGEGTTSLLNFIYKNVIIGPIQKIEAGLPEGLSTFIFNGIFGSSNKISSLIYAVSFITLWLVITYPLYKKKIFLKV